jgi:hypothetical protein
MVLAHAYPTFNLTESTEGKKMEIYVQFLNPSK